MKIAFIHYHLKTGGVTSVLREQVQALKDACEVLVLTGEAPQVPFPADTVTIAGLGYDRPSQNVFFPEDVADAIRQAIYQKWKLGCDVLHVHNPTLAKNKNFLKIIKLLQKDRIKLFLQIHDFAEDGRPLAYFPDPYVSDCHYGVVNSRDYYILLAAGLKKEALHRIFNPIRPFAFKDKDSIFDTHVLYPVRALRRKNIGEAILLSCFFKNRERLAITQPPNSPMDIMSFKGWQAFVKKKDLNVEFNAGIKKAFAELVRSSNFLITTSITEGFGYSFLEPWTASKMLCGRNLPDITRDFTKNGVQLDHLYAALRIPVEWVGREKYYESWKTCIQTSAPKFNFFIPQSKIEAAFAKVVFNDTVDFGLLDETFQKQVICHVLSSKKQAGRLIRLNPFLAYLAEVSNSETLIQNNRQAVLENYNIPKYRQQLLDIYRRVVKNTVTQFIDKRALFNAFFTLENFSLLKWGDYVE